MRVFCVATLDNDQQIENLCECITIVGGKPEICFSDVTVEFEGSKEKCELMMELFEQYTRHGIYSETSNEDPAI